MSKIDIDKFVASITMYAIENNEELAIDFLESSLQDQGLGYKDGKIISTDDTKWSENDKLMMEKGFTFDVNTKEWIPKKTNPWDFERKVSEILYKVSQNPAHFESDPDYMVKEAAKELLHIARKEFVDKACIWIESNHGRYYKDDYDEDFGYGIGFHLTEFIEDLKSYMEKQQ